MQCPSCEEPVAEGQKFCHECGASLRGVTDPTEPLDVLAHHRDAETEAAVESEPEVESGSEADAESAPDAEDGAEAAGTDAVDPATDAVEPATDAVDPATEDDDLDATGLPAGWAAERDDLSSEGTADEGPADDVALAGAATAAFVVGSEGEADPSDLWATRTDAVPVAAEPDAAPPLGEPLTITTRDSGGVATVTPLGSAGDAAADGEASVAHEATNDVAAAAAYAATTAVPSGEQAAPVHGDGADAAATTVVEQVDAGAGPPQGRWVEGHWIPGQWIDGQWVDRPESEVYVLPREGFRVRPAFVLAVLALLATLLAAVADVSSVTTDRVVDGIPNQVFTLDSLGSNLAVAGFIGTAVMLVGALLQCFGLRWGGGLTGGAGLATAGWATLTLGIAEIGLFQAQLVLDNPNVPPFTLTITRDVGYFLVLGIGVIGGLVALFSLVSSGRGGRPGLNPWVAACGALAATVLVAGPLIPAGDFGFDVNFSNPALPWQFYVGRTIHLALLLLGGVIGFLLVRTYGLGLAAGTVCVAVWLWISSLLDIGDRAFGIGGFNIGSADTSPHAVTTVGVVSTVLLLALAAVLATMQNRRP